MRRTTFLLIPALFWACNSDTFTGDDGGPDTGSDVVVGGGEGGSTDGGSSKDVSTTPKRFCQEVDAQFCADFDIPNDAGAGFTPPTTTGGWSFTFQKSQVKSSPTAVEIDTAGDAAGAAIVENPALAPSLDGGPGKRMVFEADVYLPTPGFTPDPIFVFRTGALPLKPLTYGLAAHVGMWKLAGGTSPVTLSPQPPTNQWVHVVLGIDINSGGGNVTLDIGSSHAATQVPTGVDGGTTYPGYVALGSEDPYLPQNGLTFYVDNVVVRWQ
jgi:hypothetical protein